jgi:hypothetical protein
VKFRKTSAASDEPSWTYQHTAKDLNIDSIEKGVYETLHATVASEIEAQNRRAQKEGYSEPLIKANQELSLAERLAIDGRLAEAKEHLEISENFLKQNVPEEKLT